MSERTATRTRSNGEPLVYVGTYIPPDLDEIVDELRREEGTTKQSLIERALVNFLVDFHPDLVPEHWL